MVPNQKSGAGLQQLYTNRKTKQHTRVKTIIFKSLIIFPTGLVTALSKDKAY